MAEDERRQQSVSALVEAIHHEIEASPDGRITFARFMERALTEPGLGYYATSERRPTREGDFLTAPELHPLFGSCLGQLIGSLHDGAEPGPFRVLEHGGGRGTLRDTATAGLTFEVEWARADLPDRSDAHPWLADLVLANEYLDALPVHRLLRAGDLREAWVGWRDGWFCEVLAQPSTPALAEHLAADGVELREGQRADVCLAAPRWLAAQASALVPGGLLVVIDYGHEAAELYGPRRLAGSLVTYRDHEVGDDPFDAVGRRDITAHLDLTALQRAATEVGLELVGSTTLGPFLARLGLGDRLARIGRQRDAAPDAYLEARAAVARMLDPRHLGAFRVLAWARPHDDGHLPVPPGFADDR